VENPNLEKGKSRWGTRVSRSTQRMSGGSILDDGLSSRGGGWWGGGEKGKEICSLKKKLERAYLTRKLIGSEGMIRSFGADGPIERGASITVRKAGKAMGPGNISKGRVGSS